MKSYIMLYYNWCNCVCIYILCFEVQRQWETTQARM